MGYACFTYWFVVFSIASEVLLYHGQLSRKFESIKLTTASPKIRTAVWLPPEPGLIKVNVDGAAKGCPRICGVGGIFRNYRNEILGFSSKNIGMGFAFEAEVRAIHEAIQFCLSRMICNITIESDSSLAVGWVNNHSNRPWKLITVLNQIDQWILETNCLKVSQIYREANFNADKLAKRGAAFNKDLVYFNGIVALEGN